jgi:translocation and assembly module TamB
MNRQKLIRGVLMLLGTCVLMLLIAMFLGYQLISSDKGSEWLANKLVDYSDADISWSSFNGNLIEGVKLANVVFAEQELEIRATQVITSWNASGLPQGQFTVGELTVSELQINSTQTSSPDVQPTSWPSLRLPIELSINNLEIDSLVYRANGSETQLSHVGLSGNFDDAQISVAHLGIRQNQNEIGLSGSIQNLPPYKMHITFNWQSSPSAATNLQGEGQLTGDLAQLELEHTLLQPVEVI